MPNLILWRVDFEKRNIFFFLFSFVSFCRKALDRVSNYEIMERKNRSGLRMITIVVYFLKKNRSSRKSFGEVVLLFFFEWINEELMLKRSIDRCLESRDITHMRVYVFIYCVYVYLVCVNDFVTRDANCLWNQFRDSECVIRWIWNWAVYMYKLFLTSWVEPICLIRVNSLC